MGYLDVGRTNEITEGTMKAYIVQGNNILVVNYNGNYYAIGGKCTHTAILHLEF